MDILRLVTVTPLAFLLLLAIVEKQGRSDHCSSFSAKSKLQLNKGSTCEGRFGYKLSLKFAYFRYFVLMDDMEEIARNFARYTFSHYFILIRL